MSIDYNSFDTDSFINEIRKHPCIWDYKSESYSDRLERNNTWAAICEKFTESFSEKTNKEKNIIVKELQKKWKNLRDGFTRYISRNKKSKSGSGASHTVRRYVYYKQLLFLMPLAEDRAATVGSLDAEESDTFQSNEIPIVIETADMIQINRQNTDIASSASEKSTRSQTKRKRKVSAATEDHLIQNLAKWVNQKLDEPQIEQDEDKLFLISLSGDFKRISEAHKLDAKLEIINVLKKYKTISSLEHQTCMYPQQSFFNNSNRGYHDYSTSGCNNAPGTSANITDGRDCQCNRNKPSGKSERTD